MAIGGREFVMDYNVVPASYKIEIRIASPDPNNTDTRTIIAELDTDFIGTSAHSTRAATQQ